LSADNLLHSLDTEFSQFLSRVSMQWGILLAMHAERDIVLAIPYACLSIPCQYCVWMNAHIVTRSGRGIILVF